MKALVYQLAAEYRAALKEAGAHAEQAAEALRLNDTTVAAESLSGAARAVERANRALGSVAKACPRNRSSK